MGIFALALFISVLLVHLGILLMEPRELLHITLPDRKFTPGEYAISLCLVLIRAIAYLVPVATALGIVLAAFTMLPNTFVIEAAKLQATRDDFIGSFSYVLGASVLPVPVLGLYLLLSLGCESTGALLDLRRRFCRLEPQEDHHE